MRTKWKLSGIKYVLSKIGIQNIREKKFPPNIEIVVVGICHLINSFEDVISMEINSLFLLISSNKNCFPHPAPEKAISRISLGIPLFLTKGGLNFQRMSPSVT